MNKIINLHNMNKSKIVKSEIIRYDTIKIPRNKNKIKYTLLITLKNGYMRVHYNNKKSINKDIRKLKEITKNQIYSHEPRIPEELE